MSIIKDDPLKDDPAKKSRIDSILQSARKLVEEAGFSNLTMDTIARNAGIAKGTVYLYFKDKNEVLEKVLETGFERMFERVSRNVEKEIEPEDKLKTLIYTNLMYIKENKYFFRTVFLDEVNVIFLRKKSQESFNRRRQRYAEFISKIIKQGSDAGKFKKINDQLKLSYFLISLIKTSAIYNFLNHKGGLFADMAAGYEERIKEEAYEIFDMFMNGIT